MVMRVEPLRSEDAADVQSLMRDWNAGPLVIAPGAHGAVVRDDAGRVEAFALLRETGYGFAIDEMWGKRDRLGRLALGMLARWTESTIARIARDRGVDSLPLGGIARIDNPAHCAALKKRGYEVVANVYAKDIPAEVDHRIAV